MIWEIVHRPENDAKRFELIDGKLFEFPVAGFQHGCLAGEMGFHLYDANQRESAGLVTARCGYHPPDDRYTLLGPSAAFTRKERVQYPLSKKYVARMPDMAVRNRIVLQPARLGASQNCPSICNMARSWFGLSSPITRASKSAGLTQRARSKVNSSAKTAPSLANPSCPVSVSIFLRFSPDSTVTEANAGSSCRPYLSCCLPTL